MRHTTSLAGADEELGELLLEPHPAAAPASATAAPIAAAVLVTFTSARSPSGQISPGRPAVDALADPSALACSPLAVVADLAAPADR